MNATEDGSTFRLSISAGVILRALNAAAPPGGVPAAPRPSRPRIDVRVCAARGARWSTDLLAGVPEAMACDTAELDPESESDLGVDAFDIRVGWGDGGSAEFLGVPLSPADTLVIDEGGGLRISDVWFAG